MSHHAVILAAGVGRRLSPFTETSPKCLLSVGEKSLLERMLGSLAEVSVREAILVVGHLKEAITDRFGASFAGIGLRYIENPEYHRGSIRSLFCARHELHEDSILMDADVLFPTEILARLLSAPTPSAFCLDEAFEESGEEMKLYARRDRVVAISRKPPALAYDRVGEGVGFMKVGASHGPALSGVVDEMVRAGFDGDYEEAIDRFLGQASVGWVPVGGLPWTEIDFPEDLDRARNEIWPKLAGLRARGAERDKE
jgi:choline kinase